jgi:hypothetical protein
VGLSEYVKDFNLPKKTAFIVSTMKMYRLFSDLYMEGYGMAAKVIGKTKMLEVNRTDLRQHQSRWLKKARGQRVLLIKSHDSEDDKVVLDKQFFEELRTKLESLVETLEIVMDRKLFNQILAASETLEEDVRLGKLHSLEDAFAEE